MTTAPKYAVIGSGAVGIFLGARLAAAGREVGLLARSDAARLREGGLRVEGASELWVERVAAYARAGDVPESDVVLLAIPATANDELAELLPPLLAPEGVVLVLQNGIGVDEAAAAVVGEERVVAAPCRLAAERIAPGVVRHHDLGQLVLAEYEGPAGDRLARLAADLGAAGIPATRSPSRASARWSKALWNLPFNGLSAVLDARTDRICAEPASRARAERLMEEVRAIAAAAGTRIPAGAVPRVLAATEAMAPHATSMKAARDAGRPMETEAIVGEPLRIAKAHGVECPEIRRLYEELLRLAP